MSVPLHLHVGHEQTGSSWLQAALRGAREGLRAHGLDYPQGREPAHLGPADISSGNGAGALESERALAAALAGCDAAAPRGALLSSEWLFREIEAQADLAFLPRLAGAAGFGPVRVLLLIRDPLDHAASAYQQALKRGGETGDAAAFFRAFRFPERVEAALARLEAAGVETTVRNFSRHRGDLLAVMRDWLDLPEKALPPPPAARVNRSLTAAERELQRALNAALGRGGALLADALCQRLPDVAPEAAAPAREAQEETRARLAPAVARVNARLPEAERWRCEIRDAAPRADDLALSREQLRVIAETLGGEIARLRADLADPARAVGVRKLAAALLRRAARRLGGG